MGAVGAVCVIATAAGGRLRGSNGVQQSQGGAR